jgi:hypothetical protein
MSRPAASTAFSRCSASNRPFELPEALRRHVLEQRRLGEALRLSDRGTGRLAILADLDVLPPAAPDNRRGTRLDRSRGLRRRLLISKTLRAHKLHTKEKYRLFLYQLPMRNSRRIAGGLEKTSIF